MYDKVSADLRFTEREKKIEQFWREREIFRKSTAMRAGEKSYVFYDGPPTANGKPHIGHVLTRVIKDLIPRYHTMKGNLVPRKAGWDTHGLPVELEVERALGINGKEQIEAYGMAPFIEQCKQSVWKYKGMWEDFSGTVGFWADMDKPYVTYHNTYIESEWWALKEIWNKGLLYKGFKIVPYCPRCGTPLSSHEVAQGYKDIKERSAIVRFKVCGEDAYILAWTTTPWTLPSNLALCVHPEYDYVKIKTGDYTYYLAQGLLESVVKGEYEILARFKGRELEHKQYEPLFDFLPRRDDAFFVVCDPYVTLSDGTGIVHIAPAFGEDDARVGKRYRLPFVQYVDSKGCMTGETIWEGVFCKDADKKILQYLEQRGRLFDAPVFEHNYPHCWRCDTPLIYYARESWYIEMTAVRDRLIANNKTIRWIPESIGTGRFGDWLENIQDWALSRDRYWGTPLNIWECPCGHRHCVGSIEELRTLSADCPADIELHRPYIDAVTFRCPACGGEMKRVPEVIDCWFDSGAMPFAQHHYPFENRDLFEEQFPADFISEAVDQTRGWFYSLLAISTLLFDKAPYRNVIVLGLVLDENGQKMSKSKGNAIDPFEALEKFGADAIRWYFYSNSAPWLPNRFYDRAVLEGQRKLMGTLWNTYAFYVLYANIDAFDPTKHTLDYDKLAVIDRWLLSRLHTTVKTVDKELAQYRIPEAARALDRFVDEMSNWYVRRCRERYWAKGMEQDKINAYMTLYTALVTVCKAAAPMIPFMTEDIYQNLVRHVDKDAPESIHLCDFPVCNEEYVDPALESAMDEVLKIVVLGRAARNGANIKNRQPLYTLTVSAAEKLEETYAAIIRDELNVKQVVFIDNADGLLSYVFKPQLKTVGPKYGRQLNDIRRALSELDGNAGKRELDATGILKLNLPGGTAELTADDLLISCEQREGSFSLSDNGVTVSLDTHLTDELLEEGYVNELISKLQTMRKEAGFEVTDHIAVTVAGSEKLVSLAQANAGRIAAVTLADSVTAAAPEGYCKTWDINGEEAKLGIDRIVDNLK